MSSSAGVGHFRQKRVAEDVGFQAREAYKLKFPEPGREHDADELIVGVDGSMPGMVFGTLPTSV